MAALKGKDIKIMILKDTNRIDPINTTTDWANATADIVLTGKIISLSFEEPEPSKEKITYLGSDTTGAPLEEEYILEWGTGKISGTMVMNPDSQGNYAALDELFLNSVASDVSGAIVNYQYGTEVIPNADFLVAIGDSYGVRILFKDFKFNKLNAFEASGKDAIEVSFEVETVAGSVYIQKVKA